VQQGKKLMLTKTSNREKIKKNKNIEKKDINYERNAL
jgi:hypothetical protein